MDDPRWQGLYTATHINFEELAFSHSMHKNFERWKLAITNLRDLPVHYLYSEPQHFLLYGDERAHENGKLILQPVFRFFDNAIKYAKAEDFRAEVERLIEGENAKFKQMRDHMHQVIRDSQKSGREGFGKKISIEEARIYFRKVFCAALISDQIMEIDYMDVEWSEFELLEKTGTQYFNELQTGKRGWNENDYLDLILINLMCVSPRDKYFVIEKKWKELIRDAGMGHYI